MKACELVLDFSLARGERRLRLDTTLRWRGLLGVRGRSGAGKTSLLRVLAGLERQTRGRVLLDGVALQDSARRQFMAPHRRRVVPVFQDARLFEHLDVRGNLEYARRRAAAPPPLPLPETVHALELAPLLDRRVGGLSGGECQRVAIARALLAAPRLLLLDEPVSALDARARDEVLGCIERVRDASGLPMIYVSHAAAELTRLAAQILDLDGALAEAAAPHSMVNAHADAG